MDLDSWEDSDLEFRTATPIFTSDDEQYPIPIVSPSYAPIIVPNRHPPSRFALANSVAPMTLKFGHRKQRRFDNDLLFTGNSIFGAIPKDWGRAGLNPTMAALCAQLEAMDLAEQVQLYDSVFSQLRKVDAVMLEAFFEGEAIQVQKKSPKLLADASRPQKSSKEDAEAAIRRIDKKTRKHLVRATDFVRGLEAVLINKCAVIDCGEVERCQENGKSETVYVTLDSPFLRMLAHGVGQFYGISSRTSRSSAGASRVRFQLSKPIKTSVRLSTYLDNQNAKRGA